MMAKIVTEVKVLQNELPGLLTRSRSQTSAVVKTITFIIERSAKESMQGPKGGRRYPRLGGNYHQASAPGEAPAIDMGMLVNSIQTNFPSDIEGEVYTNTAYGPHLEFGTSRMTKRPFMKPAADAAWPAFNEAMKGVLGL